MKQSDMSAEAKAYYASGRRVVVAGVPCRVRGDTKDLKHLRKLKPAGGYV